MTNDGYGLQLPGSYVRLSKPSAFPARKPNDQLGDSLPSPPRDWPQGQREARVWIASTMTGPQLEQRAECIRTFLSGAHGAGINWVLEAFNMRWAKAAHDEKTGPLLYMVSTRDHLEPVEILDALKLGLFT